MLKLTDALEALAKEEQDVKMSANTVWSNGLYTH